MYNTIKGVNVLFYRLREMLAKFFYGRCGMDRLNIFLFLVYFILWILGNIFSMISGLRVLYFVVYFINLALLFTILFRALSRNIYKRQSEKLLKILKRRMAQNQYIQSQGGVQGLLSKEKKYDFF